MAKVISVVNQKGGVGKTNISMNLAGAFSSKKHKVIIVDADPQGTALRWSSSADEEKPFPAVVVNLSAAGNKIHQEIKKFYNEYDYIIIDCPPAVDSPIPQSVLLVSDLALIPVVPSPSDLWATVAIKKLISLAETMNDKLKKLVVISKHTPKTNLAKDVMEALEQLELPISRATICERNSYRLASAYGLSVFELNKDSDKAVEEISLLRNDVEKILR